MCGITGIISRGRFNPIDLKKMNDVLLHRGPDGEGFFLSNGVERNSHLKGLIDHSPHLSVNVGFGHRRLAIVDLSPAGHQPMLMGSRYVITYNGEIYNHAEIRTELECLGYQFRSHSDTEVILAAYDAWGSACLNRFNGMWAFCILDCQKGNVFIARDRFGIKPFYYYRDKNTFIFASEIKAILTHPEVTTTPDGDYCRNYIDSGPNVDGIETIFENVNRIPPSHFLECNLVDLLDHPIHTHRYWDVKPNLSREAFDEVKADELSRKYYLLLEDAVRLRLRADVKVGSALSGGLDSSSIVYLVNQLLKEQGFESQQETFSCVYKTPGTESCDESKFIDSLAAELNVHSNQIEPQTKDIPEEYAKMIYSLDHPPESSLMSSWHTFALVGRSDVTVSLDGQGADEQLAGYLGYVFNWFAQIPISQALLELRHVTNTAGAWKRALPGICINLFRSIFGKKLTLILLKYLGYKRDPFIPLNQILSIDTQSSLLTLIHYADRTSMAFSIESRMPFMDYRVVEFLASVPATYKLHDGWTKYLARRAFSGKLPDSIVWRKDKMGWPIPERHWFEGDLESWFTAQSVNNRVLNLTHQNRNSNGDHSKKTIPLSKRIRIMNLTLWLKTFFPNYFKQ